MIEYKYTPHYRQTICLFHSKKEQKKKKRKKRKRGGGRRDPPEERNSQTRSFVVKYHIVKPPERYISRRVAVDGSECNIVRIRNGASDR